MAIIARCVALCGGRPPLGTPLMSGTINEPSGIRYRIPDASCHSIGYVAESCPGPSWKPGAVENGATNATEPGGIRFTPESVKNAGTGFGEAGPGPSGKSPL